jgi:hypothetical protein
MIPAGSYSAKLLSWIAPGLLLAPLLLVCARVMVSGVPDLAVEGDLAMQDISTRNIREGRAVLGPYSRFGFNHPGPAYLLLRLPAYYLSGCSSSSSYITVPLLIAASLAGSVLVLGRFCRGSVTILCCLLLSVYLVMTPWTVWLRDWNPFVIIFPFLLYSLACAAVGAGDDRWMPVAVLTGSLVAQTHLGGVPVVLALALAALVIRRLNGTGSESPRWFRSRPLMLTAVLGFAVWLPSLVQEFGAGEGNLTRIVGFLGDTAARVPLRVAAREWSGAVMATETMLLFPRLLRARGILLEVVFMFALLRIVALAGCLFLPGGKTRGRFMRSLSVLLLVGHAAMFFGVLQVRGDLQDYLFSWYSVTSPHSWIVIVLAVASLRGGTLKGSGALRLIITLLILPPGFILVKTLGIFGSGVYDPLAYSDQRVEKLSEDLDAFLAGNPGREWYLEPLPRELWPVSVGVVNRLSKAGRPVHLDRHFSGLVGTTPPDNALRLLLAETGFPDPPAMDTISISGTMILGISRGGPFP